ncbi:MAG: hypothetical protein RR334_00265 [Clostridia bacterium]
MERNKLSCIPSLLISLRLAIAVVMIVLSFFFKPEIIGYIAIIEVNLNFFTFFINLKVKRLNAVQLDVNNISQIVVNIVVCIIVCLPEILLYVVGGIFILFELFSIVLTHELIKISPKSEYKNWLSITLHVFSEIILIVVVLTSFNQLADRILVIVATVCVVLCNMVKVIALIRAAREVDKKIGTENLVEKE